MFIEQSAERLRLIRVIFVLLGLLPCAALVGLSGWRNSARHVEAVERECAALLGLPIEITGLKHLRPGALRLEGVSVLAATGEPIFSVATLDVEASASEVRLATGRLECSPRAVAVFARLAGDWLGQPERFSKAWVVDVDEVVWRLEGSRHPPTADVVRPAGLHAECVSGAGGRGVRVRREPNTADEIRVLSTVAAGSNLPAAAPQSGIDARRIEVHGVIEEPLPAAIVAALVTMPSTAWLAPGSGALVRGRVAAIAESGRWSGECAGVLERIDLAACTASAPERMTGEATVTISSLRFDQGRLTSCAADCAAVAGRVSQAFLTTVVGVLGCRAGPAFRSLASDQVRSYDDLSCRIRIDEAGMTIRAPGDRSGAVMRSQGLALLEEPAGPMPPERLAWLFSPPGRVPVPASSASAWLLAWLPISGQNIPLQSTSTGAPDRGAVPPQAERSGGRGGF